MLKSIEGNFEHPEVNELLIKHFIELRAASPEGSAHVLDIPGLKVPSIMMEPYNDITEPLVSNMSSEEEKYFNIPTNRSVKELLEIIKTRYPDILDINFDQKENHQNFWLSHMLIILWVE